MITINGQLNERRKRRPESATNRDRFFTVVSGNGGQGNFQHLQQRHRRGPTPGISTAIAIEVQMAPARSTDDFDGSEQLHQHAQQRRSRPRRDRRRYRRPEVNPRRRVPPNTTSISRQQRMGHPHVTCVFPDCPPASGSTMVAKVLNNTVAALTPTNAARAGSVSTQGRPRRHERLLGDQWEHYGGEHEHRPDRQHVTSGLNCAKQGTNPAHQHLRASRDVRHTPHPASRNFVNPVEHEHIRYLRVGGTRANRPPRAASLSIVLRAPEYAPRVLIGTRGGRGRM